LPGALGGVEVPGFPVEVSSSVRDSDGEVSASGTVLVVAVLEILSWADHARNSNRLVAKYECIFSELINKKIIKLAVINGDMDDRCLIRTMGTKIWVDCKIA
jgi:hypothetical protein